jgi:U6 snRNA-associated Sm-like protein LSm7
LHFCSKRNGGPLDTLDLFSVSLSLSLTFLLLLLYFPNSNSNQPVEGVLKGYDQLLNLVLDEAIEYQRSAEDILTVTDETRSLGLVVCRGTAVMAVAPTAGAEVMASNPFVTAEEGGEAAAVEEAAAA